MAGAAGVAVTAVAASVVFAVRSMLLLIGFSLYLSIGLDPLVRWLVRRRFPRSAAVAVVVLAVVAVIGGFLAVAIPPLVDQVSQFAHRLPHYLESLRSRSSLVGRLNDRFHLQARLQHMLSGREGVSLVGGVLGAGRLVLGTLFSLLVVVVLTIYFLAGVPRIKVTLYRLVPASRRSRTELISEEVFAKVGAYLLGQTVLALIAGLGTLVWLAIMGVPYPLLLGLFTALLDFIPMVGSTVAGFVVSLVALTVSFPVALATAGFYTAYRLAEDYLLVPRIMSARVEVPAVVALVAVLIGGSLLGVLGALIAIPVAASLRLVLEEVTFPRQDAA